MRVGSPTSIPIVPDPRSAMDSDTAIAAQRREANLPALHGAADAIMAARGDAQETATEKPAPRLAPPNPADRPDVRYMTPREMQDYSQDLYAAGIVTYDDYEAMAFQPELHPNYDRTVGALTGKKAEPDRPRDFLKHWQDRLDFSKRYYPLNSDPVRQAHRIVEALAAFPRQTDIFA